MRYKALGIELWRNIWVILKFGMFWKLWVFLLARIIMLSLYRKYMFFYLQRMVMELKISLYTISSAIYNELIVTRKMKLKISHLTKLLLRIGMASFIMGFSIWRKTQSNMINCHHIFINCSIIRSLTN